MNRSITKLALAAAAAGTDHAAAVERAVKAL